MIPRYLDTRTILMSIDFAILRSTLSYRPRRLNGHFVNRVKHHLHEIEALVPEITSPRWIRRSDPRFVRSSIKTCKHNSAWTAPFFFRNKTVRIICKHITTLQSKTVTYRRTLRQNMGTMPMYRSLNNDDSFLIII